jgi:hypothetical protein
VSAAPETRVFGIRLGIDPKIVVGGLFAIAVLLFFWHSRSDSDAPAHDTPASVTSTNLGNGSGSVSPVIRPVRRRLSSGVSNRAALRIRTVDATRGDIDPTLRTDLLERLQNVPEGGNGRSLFDIGEAAPTMAAIQKVNQVIRPAPLPSNLPPQQPVPTAPIVPQVNIPLKFYGFVKSARHGAASRGLFLDGDNVIVASEGEVIDNRYLVVALTAQNARMEDTQLKQGQTLPVVPEVMQE